MVNQPPLLDEQISSIKFRPQLYLYLWSKQEKIISENFLKLPKNKYVVTQLQRFKTISIQ